MNPVKFDSKNSQEIDQIFKVVCDYYGIDKDKANEKSRKRELKLCRQVGHYLAKRETKASLSLIGLVIGKKDHATVMNSCRVINDLITPLRNGVIPDRKMLEDLSILKIKLQREWQDEEDRYFLSMGTMISNQN